MEERQGNVLSHTYEHKTTISLLSDEEIASNSSTFQLGLCVRLKWPSDTPTAKKNKNAGKAEHGVGNEWLWQKREIGKNSGTECFTFYFFFFLAVFFCIILKGMF